MKLNTNQVAEKLNCSKYQVLKMRDEGKLTDLKKTKDGKKKHFSLFDSAEVNSLKKNSNGKPKIKLLFDNENETKPLNGLFSTIKSIERKVDHLIKIWS
jgi:hypothetical protein